MIKFKHAPGEWKILDQGYAHLGAHIMAGDERIASGVMEHNARLIAAAPEMLDALIYLLRVADPYRTGGMQHQRDAISMSLAAIEKATGMKIEEISS